MALKLVPEQYCRKNCLTSPIDSAALIIISQRKVDLERQEGQSILNVTSHPQMGQFKRALMHIQIQETEIVSCLLTTYLGSVVASFFAYSTWNSVTHLSSSKGQSIWDALNTIMSSGMGGWRGKLSNKGGCFNYLWQIYSSICVWSIGGPRWGGKKW